MTIEHKQIYKPLGPKQMTIEHKQIYKPLGLLPLEVSFRFTAIHTKVIVHHNLFF